MGQLRMHDRGGSCTLDEQGTARRNAEFADVVRRGLRHRRKTPEGTVRLVFDNTDGMEADIRALAERESQCCGFFSFDVEVSNEDVVLHVDAPADRAEYLDMLYQAAEPGGPAGKDADV